MKKSACIAITALLCALGVSAVDLNPNADTYVDGVVSPTSNFGTSSELRIRSLEGDPDRAQYAYVRFDISDYLSVSNGASFSLTAHPDSVAWGSTQLKVYGLPDSAGLTAQNWNEAALTYNTTGNELESPFVDGNNPLDESVLQFLGNMPAGAGGDTVTLTGAALDSFLSTRAGNTVTLLVANKYNTNRGMRFMSGNAVSNAPVLSVTGSGQPLLSAVADTYVAGNDPDTSFDNSTGDTKARLLVRSLGDPVRAYYAYIRFDISNYASISNGASFSLTANGSSQSWSDTDVEVYGLPATAGRTAQDWGETSLTYNSTGDEFIKPTSSAEDPMVASNLVLLGTMPSGAAGDTVTLTGTALDSFLNTRVGNTVTLLVANTFNTSRILQFNSREAVSNTPVLAFGAELKPDPETITLDTVADTYVNAWITDDTPADIAYGLNTNGWMTIRSRATAPTYRMQVCYIRFDLTNYTSLDAATLILTELEESSAGANVANVYGLPDVAGLTPQNWNEATLTYNTTGDELIVPFPTNAYPLVTSNLVSLGVLPDTSGVEGSTVSFSSAALDSFLETRLGNTATLLLVQPYDRDRQIAFATRESTRPGVAAAQLSFDIPPMGYSNWIGFYDVGSATNMTDNPDGDTLDNLAEFALGGDPADPADTGHAPIIGTDADDGTNWLTYVYARRKTAADIGLDYHLEQACDLGFPNWTNDFYEVTGTGVLVEAQFDAVTNRIPMEVEEMQFLKLVIESK